MSSGGDLPRWMRGTDNTAPAGKAVPVGRSNAATPKPRTPATAAPAPARPQQSSSAPTLREVKQQRSQPGVQTRKAAQPKTAENRPPRSPLVMSCLGSLWIVLGTLFVILSLGVFFGSLYLTDVLETIGKRDYLGQTKRFDEYREFFARLTSKGFEVDESKPTIVQGRTTYSWSIRPRGSTDTRSFEWDHDLQANVITPRTNGAVLMDLQNKYISVQDAEGFEFYNPDDKLALAIVHGDSSELSQILSDGGWGDADSAASLQPPLPPLTDPKHPKRKNGGLALPGEEDPEAAEEAAAAAAAGNIADGTGSGEATDVGEGEEAPPGDDGSVEVGGGEEAPGDGEETEPGDDEGTDVGTGEDTGGESSPEDGGGGEEEPGNGDDSTPVG